MSTDRLDPRQRKWTGTLPGWGQMAVGTDLVTGFLCAVDMAGGTHFDGSSVLAEALCVAFRDVTPPAALCPQGRNCFYMVFREGGHAPTFKHDTQVLAAAEAKRIGRDTGSVTHVLAAVETIQPYALPNAEEFRTHAAEHSTNGVGLWRRTRKGMMPRIVGVRVENGVAWVAGEGDGVSLYRVDVSSPPDERWFPLSSDGSDLRDSIPF